MDLVRAVFLYWKAHSLFSGASGRKVYFLRKVYLLFINKPAGPWYTERQIPRPFPGACF